MISCHDIASLKAKTTGQPAKAGWGTLSFIRTMTVGSGIAPDLLTLPLEGARGLAAQTAYRRWGITPRPENGPGVSLTLMECNIESGGTWAERVQRLP
jgi:hypothetical protein